mgnify:CR=1 FL=1
MEYLDEMLAARLVQETQALAPQLAEGPSKLSNVIIQKSIAAEINMSPLKIRL